jgi:hypothetical protein
MLDATTIFYLEVSNINEFFDIFFNHGNFDALKTTFDEWQLLKIDHLKYQRCV